MTKTFIRRMLSAATSLALTLGALSATAADTAYTQPELGADTVAILEQDGYRFKDLNKNGALDAYEDWRLPL